MRTFNYIKYFFLGAICFYVSQIILRIPILSFIVKTDEFLVLSIQHPLIVGTLIGFSAGIFEEGFRFIFKKNLFNIQNERITQVILFGLAHGLCEAYIIIRPMLNLGFSLYDIRITILERLIAIILQVFLTVIIWNGFKLNKKYIYLLIAIILHGSIDASITFFAYYSYSPKLFYQILAFIAFVGIIYIFYSRKFYPKEDINNETENYYT